MNPVIKHSISIITLFLMVALFYAGYKAYRGELKIPEVKDKSRPVREAGLLSMVFAILIFLIVFLWDYFTLGPLPRATKNLKPIETNGQFM